MALRNFLIVLGCVAFLAGLTLATLWVARARAPQDSASRATPSLSILVAARPLSGGTLLRAADFAWKDVGGGAVPGMVVRNPAAENEFLGAVTRRAFADGEPLMESDLVKSADRAFLSAVLSPGNRAVSIAVDGPQSVAGLVLPGDRVDVILTQSFGSDTTDAGRKSVGETVLKNIRVIAVDQWMNAIAKPAAKEERLGTVNSRIPATITLEVTDREAERVLVAVQLGKVQLAVRALEGSGTAPTDADDAGTRTWAADVSPALRMLGRAPTAADIRPEPPIGAAGQSSSRTFTEVMHGSKTETR